MRRTENESPDKVVWFSLTLGDIILRVILLQTYRLVHSYGNYLRILLKIVIKAAYWDGLVGVN
jgi:hypothetical protein